MPKLIDIGLNLTHDSFDPDRDDVVASALAAGVARMIVTGTSITASARAVELSLARPGILYATAGIHPHHASEFDDHSMAALRALLGNASVVAVGECGLDYYRNFSPPDAQRQAFEAQLALAAETRLPVFLHQRDAHADTIGLLRDWRDRLVGGVAHCFTGSRDELEDYLELGLGIGITGWICDERRGQALRDAVRHLPLDRLFVETDAPYLLPRDLDPLPKNRRNEPKYLPHIVERLAVLTGFDVGAIAAASSENAHALFALA